MLNDSNDLAAPPAGQPDDASALAGINDAYLGLLRLNFDPSWYVGRYPSALPEGHDPFLDYMTTGWQAGRDPSPRFSTSRYLARNADVRASGMNPYHHWLLYGLHEGRSGLGDELPPLSSWDTLSTREHALLSNIFSLNYYALDVGNLAPLRGVDAAQEVSRGILPGRRPTPTFDDDTYRKSHPAIVGTPVIPFLHFLFGETGEAALEEVFTALEKADLERMATIFDADWYLYSYPEVESLGVDAFIHFMTAGWQGRRDPFPEFSTSAYLLRYPDIAAARINPFAHWILHGRREGRTGKSATKNFRLRSYAPTITAILLDSCDAALSPKCVASVLRQTYPTLDIVIAGSTLAKVEQENLVAAWKGSGTLSFLSRTDEDCPITLLDAAVARTDTDLVWVVEGDGIYDDDYLTRMASSFADGSVQLGFGRRRDADWPGDVAAGRPPRSAAWRRHLTRPAAAWLAERLRSDSLTACRFDFLWRRRPLPDDIWRRAASSSHLGFWHLFVQMASGGQVAWVRDARFTAPDREPAVDPLAEGFGDERLRLMTEIEAFWGVFDASGRVGGKLHVLLVTHGIFAGGAENFPIQLANQLMASGLIVSLLIFKTDDINVEMKASLNPGVSIYESDWVYEFGCALFIRETGCSIVHSHGVIGERFFFVQCGGTLAVPYLSTLHGSYENSSHRDLPDSVIAEFVRRVDLFVYTADKNLEPIVRNGADPTRLVKMTNAMPVDTLPFPFTRQELGIATDAVIFTLVARGVKQKGWATAIAALKTIQKRHPTRAFHLCLVGEGDEPDRLRRRYGRDPSISFLGFQLRIHGLYRLTDVAIVPTRFSGESYPLCMIQSLQVGTPVIATDIGEIASMLYGKEAVGGLLVNSSQIEWLFRRRFVRAMRRMVDDDLRARYASGARELGGAYDMAALTDSYIELYCKVAQRFAAERAIARPS